MPSRPAVSVIVPTRNESKYIEPTLQAVRAQAFPKPYEVIVADYRSDDDTVPRARKHADRVVRVRRPGPAAGRNEGAAAASGRVFVFLDADTWPRENLLATVQRTFSNPRVAGATCPILPVSADLEDFLLFWFINNYFRTAILAGVPHSSGVCFVARRESFEAAGGFDEKLTIAEDVELAQRLRKFGRFRFMSSTLVMTSPRRIQGWGIARTASVWAANYMKILTLGGAFGSLGGYRPIR